MPGVRTRVLKRPLVEPTWGPPRDADGAFVDGPAELLLGHPGGPLDGTRLVVKDVVDVIGRVTGVGHPAVAAASAPAVRSASVVDCLVSAGASVIGRTVSDEFAYSLSGTNVHLGTPRNATWPGHEPGGSSSGSASAVSSRVADLGLGTDTGGSIRVPASYCGLVGWRPTHGLLPVDGVVALAPSFDTVGLLVRPSSVDLLVRAAGALGIRSVQGRGAAGFGVKGVLVAEDLLDLVSAEDAASIVAAALRVGARLGVDVEFGPVLTGRASDAAEAFRVLQGAEAWEQHGDLVSSGLMLGPGVGARFAAARALGTTEVAAAREVRLAVTQDLLVATADGWIVAHPAASGPPPALGTADPIAKARVRATTLCLTAPAGLAGAPVVVVPTRPVGQPPVGVAFVGRPGRDAALLVGVLGARFA